MQRTIHVHQNDNAILRVAFLLVLSFTLTGCALTRVSASSHDKDVDELNVIGLNLDAARQKAIVDGFVCSKDANLNQVQTESGSHKWLQTECSKKSLELFCPQMRFIVFNVDPDTNKVLMWGNILISILVSEYDIGTSRAYVISISPFCLHFYSRVPDCIDPMKII